MIYTYYRTYGNGKHMNKVHKKVVEKNLEKFKDGVWIPKKEYFCPTCKTNLGIKEKWRDITDYCPWCGQALDWSEERGE